MGAASARRSFLRGARIFTEGDAPDVAYLVESGRIEVWTAQGSRRLTLSYLGPGEILGEMAVIDRAPRSASADALTDVVVTEIRADQLRARLDEADPVLRSLLIGLLARYRRGLRVARGAKAEDQDKDGAHVEQQRRVADKIRLERELLEALERDELRVVFQPIFDLQERVVAGFEALVRWDHPTRGAVSPTEFIALAEETSLIVPVGEYALRRACRSLAELDRRGRVGPQPWIAVNISARQSLVPDFADLLARTAIDAGLDPRRLKAEITESLALDYTRVSELIARCRMHGISVALDDFGTGHSGLGHLYRLDFDSIKLDQAFVRPLPGDGKAAALVCGIVRLLHGMGADVVAEGVENIEQARTLKAHGVRYLQGWLVGKPVDPSSTDPLRVAPQLDQIEP
ncbi:MAG: EAL domain-containing protein [Xanthomonadales bacterium]|nr:hypothetical protein [Xanthomonadales bacterium]MCC6594133.1 EAL domain-containing protein [Xanthomonadales bacterium]MCE7931341.1 EAL domain-containing protein [Xanthomonadales bacterium PRO6]